MEPSATFKITCTWLTGGASELPVVFLSPDGSDIGTIDPVPLTLEPAYEEAPHCEIEISFNSETQFELHRFEVISVNKNLEVYRDEDCGGYLATLKGTPVQVDSLQAFKFTWDAKSPEMVRALKFKMQSQLLAQLLFSKMGTKATLPPNNLPSVPPITTNSTANNNNSTNMPQPNNTNIPPNIPTKSLTSSAAVPDLIQSHPVHHHRHDEISGLIERQEQKYLQLLSEVEKRMDEKLAKLQTLAERRFDDLERRIIASGSSNRSNTNNSS